MEWKLIILTTSHHELVTLQKLFQQMKQK